MSGLDSVFSELFWARDGQIIDITEWGRLRHGDDALDNIRVGYDKVDYLGHEVALSTVWIGINLTLGRSMDGPPHIFETMVFSQSDDFEVDGCARYCTEEEARAGHLLALADLLQGRLPWFIRNEDDW